MVYHLRKIRSIICIVVALLGGISLYKPTQAQEVNNMDHPLLLAHYMPWYQTPDVSGYWGWHWTMNQFDPTVTNESGRPEFASQYMPLTGLYDSQDDAVLEYQVLLMKLSGIDGVMVDWYGTANFRDYAILNYATNKLFEYTRKAGLTFAICYEDRTLIHMVEEGYLRSDEAISHGQDIMRYLQETWFTDETYLRYSSQPLLFVFGPLYFRTTAHWEDLFSVLENPPALVTLDGHMDWAALSSYPWPPMSMAGGIELSPPVLESYLDLFYRNARRKDLVVGSAFPSFHDIYAEAGIRSSYGYIDPRDGETLRLTLDRALQNGAGIIQLVTWNDYGEGTMIEPTEETGYQYLEIVQQYRTELDTEDFAFTHDDLRLPLQLFELRKEYADDAEVTAQLNAVFNALITGEIEKAVEIIEGIQS